MVGVEWTLVAMIAGGVIVGVVLVALLARLVRGAPASGKEKSVADAANSAMRFGTTMKTPNLSASAQASSPPASKVADDEVRVVQAPVDSPQSNTSLAQPAPALGREVVLTMTCGPLPGSEGFTREVKLVGGDGVYTWTRGARDSNSYEHWEMKLDGENGFSIVGEYIEATPGLKPISFVGTVVGTTVSGQGMRGPRASTIHS